MTSAVYSQKAEVDLEEIVGYIAQHNQRRAATFVAELRAAGMRIARTPRDSPLVAGFKARGLRRRSYRNHSICYRGYEDAIEIARVPHHARDQAAALVSNA